MERERPDVVCLQELKAELAQLPEVVQRQDYHAAFPADPVYNHPPFDPESRIVQVELGDLIIASMYVPNGGKDYPGKIDFLTRLIDWARQLRSDGRELLLCGDVNIARTEMDVHPKYRKVMAVGQRPEERAMLETLLGTGLTDVGRAMDPDNPRLFTWWAPWRNLRARNIGWRLDYLLASPGVATRAEAAWSRRMSAPAITRPS